MRSGTSNVHWQDEPDEHDYPAAAALEHPHLVAEHQELDVPLLCSTTSGSEETADQEVQEREQHGAPPVGEIAC